VRRLDTSSAHAEAENMLSGTPLKLDILQVPQNAEKCFVWFGWVPDDVNLANQARAN